MPNRCTHPAILDHVQSITTRFLIDRKYMTPGKTQGSIEYAIGSTRTGSAWVTTVIDQDGENGVLWLSYKVDGGQQKNYPYQLVTLPSNLGKGRVWYIVCPATGDLCRTLYCIEGRYLSRKAFAHAMYHNQTESKAARRVKPFPREWPPGKRKTHGGKFTKAYQKHLTSEQKALAYWHGALMTFG